MSSWRAYLELFSAKLLAQTLSLPSQQDAEEQEEDKAEASNCRMTIMKTPMIENALCM